MARKNLDIEGYYVAAFLAQQAVEKLLKAAYILEGRRVPKTHYLDELARPLAVPEDLYRDFVIAHPGLHAKPLSGHGGRCTVSAVHVRGCGRESSYRGAVLPVLC